MRKYQRKAVRLIQQHYQSTDPMRWVHIAVVMNINRPMTEREARVFRRRATELFRQLGYEAKKLFDTFTTILTSAVESITMLAEAFRRDPDRFKLDLSHISIKMPEGPEPDRLYNAHARFAPTIEGLSKAPIIPAAILGITMEGEDDAKRKN